MSKQVITISTKYPGAAPTEVENSVTKKVEDAISSLEKLDNIKSQSLEGNSKVIVEFKSNVDISEAMEDAQRKVNAIAADLPEDAKAPVISKFSVDEAPIMKMSVHQNPRVRELYEIVKQRIVPNYLSSKGLPM
jgi:HAE1 family hydrophobic/amphiphilic exporter-1